MANEFGIPEQTIKVDGGGAVGSDWTSPFGDDPIGLTVGIGGDVVIEDKNGDQVTLKNRGSGTTWWGVVTKVVATGTTAEDIVALY